MNNKVYPSDSSLNNMIRARQFELEGKWAEARVLRKFERQDLDVQAIDLILESNKRGDEYRRLSSGVVEAWEARQINNSQLHEQLTEAWNKVYK